MQQVIWNLLLNAVKFTPPGGRVRIWIGRAGKQIHVSVSDTGCGMSVDFLPHAFERFRQAEGSSSRMQRGLGLGLTLVRELIELHGGTVHAASGGKDQGSTFTLVLPIPTILLTSPTTEWNVPPLPAQSEPVPPSVPPSPLSALLAPLLDGINLLVVDDDPDAREALANLLQLYGARVRLAGSVVEAMAALETELPDVLISDLGMPGDDGYELIRRVRLLPTGAGGRLPSLAVSAYATAEHHKKALRSGFQKHLEKPVAPTDLVTEVARLAGRLEGQHP